jgi:hypothetical protein
MDSLTLIGIISGIVIVAGIGVGVLLYIQEMRKGK